MHITIDVNQTNISYGIWFLCKQARHPDLNQDRWKEFAIILLNEMHLQQFDRNFLCKRDAISVSDDKKKNLTIAAKDLSKGSTEKAVSRFTSLLLDCVTPTTKNTTKDCCKNWRLYAPPVEYKTITFANSENFCQINN